MYKHKVLITAVLVCLAVSVSNAANTVYVDANSPNDPGSGTSEDPFRRIQDAINYAVSGDAVEIRAGVYTGSGNYDLDPNGKAIAIRSTDPDDAEVVANTIIDPNRAGRGFYLHSGEDANCIISGLTIKNAYTTGSGAGIYCQQSSPTIISCSLIDNHAEQEGSGGAVFCMESNSLFVNCTVSSNYAYDGGGMEIRSGSPRLVNCIISNNHAVRYGGGVDCYDQGNPNIVNCAISNNTASDGGGVECSFGSPHLINCIISNNYAASYGGGVDCYYSSPHVFNCSLIYNKAEPAGRGGAICLWTSNVNIKNSILWANNANIGAQLYLQFESSASVGFCDVQGGASGVVHDSQSTVNWGDGNIDIGPCFASFDPDGDPNLWDLHLQSTSGRWNPDSSEWVIDANFSQCIDAGDPGSYWSVEPWPNGKRINVGAYGGTGQASKSGNIADLNVDGRVNFPDLAELGKLWGESQSVIEDLDKNGTVGIGDLDILVENWLWEK